MPSYQILFTGKNTATQIRDEFSAESDTTAILVADWIFDACSETFASYELWSGARQFMPLSQMGVSGLTLSMRSKANSAYAVQRIVADRVHVLMGTHRSIARSRRLLHEARKLKTLLGSAADDGDD